MENNITFVNDNVPKTRNLVILIKTRKICKT